MKLVQVDIHGTRGLALRDAKGSRVTVARVHTARRLWLRYICVHGRSATVTRRQDRWEVSLWDGLRTTRQPRFILLRSALAVARQHVGLAVATMAVDETAVKREMLDLGMVFNSANVQRVQTAICEGPAAVEEMLRQERGELA